MGLRLFHITEFAQSMLSPAAQREARHPALAVVLASLWLAVAGNLPLWRELWRLPMDTLALLWISLCFALLCMAALGTLFSVLNWSWLLRPVITLLLWLVACNTLLLWAGQGYLQVGTLPSGWRLVLAQLRALPLWQLLLTFGLLALLPTILLWSSGLRRIALMHRLPQNLLLLVTFLALLGATWFAGRGALLPLLQDQPRWLELLNPFNTLLSLRH